MDSESKYDYFDQEAIIEELEAIYASPSSLKKLALIGQRFCNYYSLKLDGADLAQEAITRLLEGTRHLPNDVDIVSAIGRIMGSVAEGVVRSQSSDIELTATDVVGINEEQERIYGESDTIEEEVDADYAINRILDRFEGNDEALAIIESTILGDDKATIVSKHFSGNKTAYESARRQFRRALNTMHIEGSSDD